MMIRARLYVIDYDFDYDDLTDSRCHPYHIILQSKRFRIENQAGEYFDELR